MSSHLYKSVSCQCVGTAEKTSRPSLQLSGETRVKCCVPETGEEGGEGERGGAIRGGGGGHHLVLVLAVLALGPVNKHHLGLCTALTVERHGNKGGGM